MSRKQKNRVGVIGLGQIGSKVSAGLRSAGFSVYVWNRSPRAEPNFLGSAVEVVDLCDTIQLFVPDDAALDKVIRTITAALRPRHVILAHPTIAPATAIELGAIVESTGARYVDAPFSGGRAEAANRQLVYYVGGSETAIAEARPVLQATGRSIVTVGGIGDATRLKLSLQVLTALTLEGLSEMVALARAGGVKPEVLLDALDEDPVRSNYLSEKLAAMVKGNFEGGTPLRHLYRDLQLALRLAASNPPVPAAGTVAGLLFGAMKRGWAESDVAILSRAFESETPPADLEKQAVAPSDSTPAPEPVEDIIGAAAVPSENPPAPRPGLLKKPDPTTTLVPAEPADPPMRSGMIPETHGGRGAIQPRRGLELVGTSPVRVGPPTPATTPVKLPTMSPAATATPLARPPAAPPPPPAPVRPATPTGAAPLSQRQPALPESPNFPAGPPHRVVRRLSDTTTNLQALLQSPLGGAKPVTAPASSKPPAAETFQPPSPGARTVENPWVDPPAPAPPGANGDGDAPDEVVEAIVSEILPPAVAPVVPGDIRPTQRVPLRSAGGAADASAPRPRLIREQKTRGWLNRLIGG